MKPLFIIPARGGSKGIPGKNIKPFNGKPLICHSIDCARAIADDRDICLTTDSEEICRTAEEYGLQVPFLRPAELATDTAGSREVMLHAIDFYNKELGRDYDTIVLLQPTSPLREPEDVRQAMKLFEGGNTGSKTPDGDDKGQRHVDMVVSVKESSANPYYNLFETDGQGWLHISKGEGGFTRRQDAPKVWEYNGAVYVISADSLREMPMSRFPRILMSPMDAARSVDLDSPLDWFVAEQIASGKMP